MGGSWIQAYGDTEQEVLVKIENMCNNPLAKEMGLFPREVGKPEQVTILKSDVEYAKSLGYNLVIGEVKWAAVVHLHT
jgi:hypothetical protein